MFDFHLCFTPRIAISSRPAFSELSARAARKRARKRQQQVPLEAIEVVAPPPAAPTPSVPVDEGKRIFQLLALARSLTGIAGRPPIMSPISVIRRALRLFFPVPSTHLSIFSRRSGPFS